MQGHGVIKRLSVFEKKCHVAHPGSLPLLCHPLLRNARVPPSKVSGAVEGSLTACAMKEGLICLRAAPAHSH